MAHSEIYVGNTEIKTNSGEVKGGFVTFEDKTFYKIEDYHLMRPFFMSLVSHSDHWMFISSNGGISAGRKDENRTLFPYYTADKITQSVDNTGSVSILKINIGEKICLWEPFSSRYSGIYKISRNLYKSTIGNHIIFEEINEDFNLQYRISWQFSDKYGFVRKSQITNNSGSDYGIELIDGIQNIVPYGISADLQNSRSNLGNAYKRSELEKNSGLGIFSLSAMIVDKAEPSEALRCTAAWSMGLEKSEKLLSSLQLDLFRNGGKVTQEDDIKAEPGAYLIHSDIQLNAKSDKSWYVMSDVNQDFSDLIEVIDIFHNKADLLSDILSDIDRGTMELRSLVAMADGLQLSADKMSTSRHYSNVLFNILRGGIFDDQYVVNKADFEDYVNTLNKNLVSRNAQFFSTLEESLSYTKLIEIATAQSDSNLIRICYEYLPLSFSRRHGDPSRPWNRFAIEGKNEKGVRNKNYEGNWRDIFQNWEALSFSFPEYTLSMITKFINASTIDGYNPYRITREGIDWETIEPDDPWSYIGYWGDHQIIYLLKLLEIAKSHHSEKLESLLVDDHFVYANVPYRIKPFEDILVNPQDTIDFDEELEDLIGKRVNEVGGDGKLIWNSTGEIHRVNLSEKLLLTFLTKISNFIPDGGIWLNTQRPEWNDANNALVGNGVSMVTLCYLNRYVSFIKDLLKAQSSVTVSAPLASLLEDIHKTLAKYQSNIQSGFSSSDRRSFIVELGNSGEKYRNSVYELSNTDKRNIGSQNLNELFDLCQEYFTDTIRTNKREDGLYHSYNLIDLKAGADIKHLYEMLEGQVAVISSGLLNAEEVKELLDKLKQSKIFREDQYSYMLYPNRELPGFLSKNVVPKPMVEKSTLLVQMIEDNDTSIIVKDIQGNYHFNGSFKNAGDLKIALKEIGPKYKSLIDGEYQYMLDLFEEVFNHQAFTGRSGTFYGYEGLGSIYWHMVSKLLLAVKEVLGDIDINKEARDILVDHYYEIRAGIGINKSPALYGAFPTDPYSHTPWTKGAQQPGMTGQVKEDIISRWGELGVSVKDSTVIFNPTFLHPEEFIQAPEIFEYVAIDGKNLSIEIKSGQLCFTYCQVPIVYEMNAETPTIRIFLNDGSSKEIEGNILPTSYSKSLFERDGMVTRVQVNLS